MAKIIFTKTLLALKARPNLFFIALLGVFAAVILFGDRNSVYSIKGNSQTITITTTDNAINKWRINHGSVFTMDELACPLTLHEPNHIVFEPNVKLNITVEQFKSTGFFLITARKENGLLATIEYEGKRCPINDYLELTIPVNLMFTFPFEGVAFIGEDVGAGVDKLLLEGSVDVLEKQFFTAKRYIGETVSLNMGDRVRFSETYNEGVSKGFIRFGEDKGIYFSVTSQTDTVYIERFGSSTVSVSPSVWSRLINDPIVAALGSLFALLFLLMEFFMAFNQIFRKDKHND